MTKKNKRIEDITEDDLLDTPVWQFINIDTTGETVMRPIAKTPVTDLTGRIVGTQVAFGTGEKVWALIGNVDVNNPLSTKHFLTLSILRRGRWFTMSRYHDFDYNELGPEALATFCGQRIQDVFPIAYDISAASHGDRASLIGVIDAEPQERLTDAQIIALAVQ